MDFKIKDILKTTKDLFHESSWFNAYCTGVLLALSITLIYDILKIYLGILGTFISLAILVFITVTAIIVGYRIHARRKRLSGMVVVNKSNPPKCRGLVLLISSPEPAKEAIDYHLSILECCWVVVTPQKKEYAATLDSKYGGINGRRIIPRHLKDEYDASGCYELIKDIYQNEVPRFELQSKDVIIDITGGTKPMSATAMLAAIEMGAPVEHVPTDFSQTQKIPLPPIEISVSRTEK